MGHHFSKITRSRDAIKYTSIDEIDKDSVSDVESTNFTRERKISGLQRLRNSRIVSLLIAFTVYLTGWFTRDMMSSNASEVVMNVPSLGIARFAVIPEELTHVSVEKVFWNNYTFAIDRDDEDSERAWDSYFSRFIALDDDTVRDAGLPPSTRYQGRQVYSVAAYHHLHCLHVIKTTWGMLKANGPDVLEEPFPGLESLAEGYTYEGHVSHCIDMIRQALECHADPTLEPMLKDDGLTSGGNLASGWGGTPHLCRNFQALTEWIDSPEQNPIASVEAFVGHSHEHGGH